MDGGLCGEFLDFLSKSSIAFVLFLLLVFLKPS